MNKKELIIYLNDEIDKHQRLYLMGEVTERVGFRQSVKGIPVDKLKQVKEQQTLTKDYLETLQQLIKEIEDERFKVPCSETTTSEKK